MATAALIVAAGLSSEAAAQSTQTPGTGTPTAVDAPAQPAAGPSAQVLPGAQRPSPSGSQDRLPPVNVDAPRQARAAAPRTAPGAASTPQPQPTAATDAAQSTGNVASGSGGEAGANPYADPAAPYKIDRSASGKFTEPLLNTPKTITTIPKEVIQDKGATSIRELVRTTPGLTLGTGEGGNAYGDRILIRGFDARNDVFIDGIRDIGVPSRDAFAIEQIEILKGPSATIGGRGTAGGAINIITKQAADKDFAKSFTRFGTDGMKRETIDVNKVVNEQLAVRANGMWQESNIAGRDKATDDRWGGQLAATYKATSSLKFMFDYYHLQTNAIPDWGVPTNPLTHRPVTENGINRNNWYGIYGRDFYNTTVDVGTGSVEYKFNQNAVLTSRFRYGMGNAEYVASAPENVNLRTGTVSANAKSRYQDNETYVNQTDLLLKFDTFGLQHAVVTGFEFSRENIMRDTFRFLATESFGTVASGITLDLNNPSSMGKWSGLVQRSFLPTYLQLDTSAAYVFDTIKLNEQWILNGGLRYDRYNINQLTSTANNRTLLYRDDTLVNWNAGLTYKPAANGAVYVAYATSSNPVGQEVDAGASDYGGLATNNVALSPENNKAIEVGTKWELFERHMLLTAALFQLDKTNARETVGAVVRDTGAYRVRGIDVGVQGNITREWSVYGGVVLLNTEVLESAVASNVGLHLANVAHQSFNLLTKYKLTDKLTVGGAATYASTIFGGTFAASTPNILPEHWRFDAMAEYKINKNWALAFNVLNLTNELYYDAFYRSANPFAYVAPGRAAYVTLEVKY